MQCALLGPALVPQHGASLAPVKDRQQQRDGLRSRPQVGVVGTCAPVAGLRSCCLGMAAPAALARPRLSHGSIQRR